MGVLHTDESDLVNRLHIYVPTPPTADDYMGPAAPAESDDHGTYLNMGHSVVNKAYAGFTVRTYGHVYLSACGLSGTAAAHGQDNGLDAYSRVTVQAQGQAVLQSINQGVYLLAGGDGVFAANGDAYVTANGGVTLVAGWIGPNPQMDTGPTTETGAGAVPHNPLQQDYVSCISNQDQWSNYIDGFFGTLFTFKFASDLVSDVRHSDAPAWREDPVGAIDEYVVQPLTAVMSNWAAMKAFRDGGKALGISSDLAPTANASSPSADWGGSLFAPLGDGINLYPRGGILAVTPNAINMYGLMGMQLGSVSSTFYGVDAEVFGMSQAKLTSWKDVSINAGGQAKIVAGDDLGVLSRKGNVGVRAKKIQIGYARTIAEMASAVPVPDLGPSATTVNLALGLLAVAEGTAMMVSGAESGSFKPGSSVPLGIAMGALAAGSGVAAVMAIQSRFQVATPSMPASMLDVMDLDAHAGEESQSGDAGAPVVAAGKESPYQAETDDIFLKARKTIRLKSNDAVKISAARSASVRVGTMMVRVRANTGDKDEVVVGRTSTSDPTDPGDVGANVKPPFIRVTGRSGVPVRGLAGQDPKIEMVLGDSGPGVKLELDEDSFKYTNGAGTFTIDNSSVKIRNLQLDVDRALTVTPS